MSLNISAIQRTPRETASAEVLRQLIDHFLPSGDIRIGHKLPSERVLAEQFGIGRAAVRDALRTMEVLNLIEIRPGDGTYVKNSGPALMPQLFRWALAVRQPAPSELLEARLEVEATIARLAAERYTDADLAALEHALGQMRNSKESEAIETFVDADIRFHLVISTMAQIPVLADFVTGLRALLEDWMRRTLAADDTRAVAACDEHESILQAIRDVDPDRAAAAMRAHIANATERLYSLHLLEPDDKTSG